MPTPRPHPDPDPADDAAAPADEDDEATRIKRQDPEAPALGTTDDPTPPEPQEPA